MAVYRRILFNQWLGRRLAATGLALLNETTPEHSLLRSSHLRGAVQSIMKVLVLVVEQPINPVARP